MRRDGFGVVAVNQHPTYQSNIIVIGSQYKKVIASVTATWIATSTALIGQAIMARVVVMKGQPPFNDPYYDSLSAVSGLPPALRPLSADFSDQLESQMFDEFGRHQVLQQPIEVTDEYVTIVQTFAYVPNTSMTPGDSIYNIHMILSVSGRIEEGEKEEWFGGYKLR